MQSSMPHLKSIFQDIAGSTCFANLDLAHGYSKVSLAPESQETMSIQTPICVHSSMHLLQGRSDAGNNFQSVLKEKYDSRFKRCYNVSMTSCFSH